METFFETFWKEYDAAASAADFEIEMPPDPVTSSAAARVAAEDAHAQAATWDATFHAVDDSYTKAQVAAYDARDAVAKADNDNVLDAIDHAEVAEAASSSIMELHIATKHVSDDAADAAALADAAAEAASAIEDGYKEALAIESEDWF